MSLALLAWQLLPVNGPERQAFRMLGKAAKALDSDGARAHEPP